MPGPEIVGLGVSPLDILMRVEAFPEGREVQRALGCVVSGGGPVATAMAAASALGATTAMIDRIGEDWRGRLVLEDFLRWGVDTRHVEVERGAESSLCTILVRAADGDRAVAFAPGSARDVSPEELPVALIAGARVLHLNGRHPAACLEAVRIAREHGVTVSFDGGAGRWREELGPLVEAGDLCIVARPFAEACTATTGLAESAAALRERCSGVVVVTDGAAGSLVLPPGEEPFRQPAIDAGGVTDTTGCGDVYHGAFLAAWVRGRPPADCAERAARAAGLTAARLGGRGALPELVSGR